MLTAIKQSVPVAKCALAAHSLLIATPSLDISLPAGAGKCIGEVGRGDGRAEQRQREQNRGGQGGG